MNVERIADQRAADALGVHLCPVVSALTAQHSREVEAVFPVPAAQLESQLRALSGDLPPRAIKTGLLGSVTAIETVARWVDHWRAQTPAGSDPHRQLALIVDPVLGDGGRLYSGLGADMVPAMYSLCSKADLIVPNVTEAALLLGDPLPGVGSAEQAAAQAARLTRVAPQVVVTGVTGIGGGRYIGCVGAARGGEGYAVKTPLQPRMFHGTGDIFAAVLVGRILRGNVPQAAVQAAAAFVAECIRQTPEGADERLGVWLENALPKLRQE